MPGYAHTQRAPLCLLLYAVAAIQFTAAIFTLSEPALPVILAFAGVFTIVLAAGFHWLSVTDRQDHLAIRFGPLPLFRCTVDYREITAVETGRTTFLDGLGIHYSLRGGWVWNIWGRSCVVIHMSGRRFYLGTNDAPALTAFLQTKISPGRRQ